MGGGGGGRVLLVAVVAAVVVGVMRLLVLSLGRVAVLLRVPLLLQLWAMTVEEVRGGSLRHCPWMGNGHSVGWICGRKNLPFKLFLVRVVPEWSC